MSCSPTLAVGCFWGEILFFGGPCQEDEGCLSDTRAMVETLGWCIAWLTTQNVWYNFFLKYFWDHGMSSLASCNSTWQQRDLRTVTLWSSVHPDWGFLGAGGRWGRSQGLAGNLSFFTPGSACRTQKGGVSDCTHRQVQVLSSMLPAHP